MHGGTSISDEDIIECNRLIFKMGELDAGNQWKLGLELGLLEDSDRNCVLQTFSEWDQRDKLVKDGQTGAKETTNFVNADS